MFSLLNIKNKSLIPTVYSIIKVWFEKYIVQIHVHHLDTHLPHHTHTHTRLKSHPEGKFSVIKDKGKVTLTKQFLKHPN